MIELQAFNGMPGQVMTVTGNQVSTSPVGNMAIGSMVVGRN